MKNPCAAERCRFVLTAALLLIAASTISASTITVTTLDDSVDFGGARQVGNLPGPDGKVSFREAVTAANNTPGPDTIAFAIAPSTFWLTPGVGLLRLEKGPFIVTDDATTIDFSTQTTNIGDTNPNGAEIGIYGLEANGWGVAAIFLNANDCIIKGLGDVHQRGYAVSISGARNRVVGCRTSGPLHAAVNISGLSGPATHNIVGGTASGEGNTLSGVSIVGPADDNLVIGNPFVRGVRVQGVASAPARRNRIGGPTMAESNVISGAGAFSEEGAPYGAQVLIVDADDTTVEGNFIGTTADGLQPFRPQHGPTGVEVRDARSTIVKSNVIAGLRVQGRNHSANEIFGEAVWVNAVNADSTNTLVETNTIGLGADRVTPIETYFGIKAAPVAGNRRIPGTRIVRNVIGSVERNAIFVSEPGKGVMLSENSLRDSGDIGIDLSHFWDPDGPTPNDAGDPDDGGNQLQNFPVLHLATAGNDWVIISASLDSHPSETYRIEFFTSPYCHPSGFGEGATFLGAKTVTTDASGNATFSASFMTAVAPGTTVTATATRLSTGDTSEFSACTTAVPAPPQALPSAAPASGTAPLLVQFSSEGSSATAGTIVSYLWRFGDGEESTEASPAHVYGPGEYTATLTVTDSHGNSSLDEPVLIFVADDGPRGR